MRANVFRAQGKFGIEEMEKPRAGVGEAVVRTTLTTICGTDLHIVRGEYPVKAGLVIGHELVGVIEQMGPGLSGPGGKERMPRLMEMVRTKRVDLTPLLTHRYALADIGEAYALFGDRREGVIKVAITP